MILYFLKYTILYTAQTLADQVLAITMVDHEPGGPKCRKKQK